jgi:hypothetical protein
MINRLIHMVRNGHNVFFNIQLVHRIIVISYHNHFVPAISYHSENHFRTITISYHKQIDTLLPFRTICRSKHYDHFVPYADRYII